jgi:hypothetical protein
MYADEEEAWRKSITFKYEFASFNTFASFFSMEDIFKGLAVYHVCKNIHTLTNHSTGSGRRKNGAFYQLPSLNFSSEIHFRLQNSGLPTSRAGTVHCCENRI